MQSASTGCIRTVSISSRILNTTRRRDCDARCARSSSSILIRSLWPGGSISEGIVQSKTKPVLAKAIETTPEALIVIMESGSVSIPWEKCSERLAHASLVELNRAERSPSGYGIHWPLIDEVLAVCPLLRAAASIPWFRERRVTGGTAG